MVGGEPFRGRRKGDARAKKARAEGGASGGETREKYAFGGGRNAAAVGGVKEKCKEKHFSLAYAAQGCYYRAKSVERELCR